MNPNPSNASGEGARADVVVVLAAGQGTRMRSPRPKVLHELCGRPMLGYVLDQALALEPRRVLVVVGHGADEVRSYAERAHGDGRVVCVVQERQLGTGHAVAACLPELGARPGRVVVLYGDMPVLAGPSLARLCAAQREGAVALLTARPRDARGFGRVVRDAGGTQVERIVEERDAAPDVRALREVNVGVYAFPGADLVSWLPRLGNENAQGEFYLTDVVALARGAGRAVLPVELEDEAEAIGVNTLAHLAEARAALQQRILEGHLARGVAIEDPATTYVDWDVQIGAGTRILPCTVIRAGVTIGSDCEVGPFTHLRAGAALEDGAEVGNFTEAKNARLGPHAKAKHLSYLGDATIGAHVNIGAGTIFANYDGRAKHASQVGERAFVGSGTILVAPARVGAGAVTGAGAVLTRGSDVPPGATWVGVPARPLERRARAAPQPDPEEPA